MASVTAAVWAVLLASLTINAGQAWLYLGQRDKITAARAELRTTEQQRDGARELAGACSRAVDDLRSVADKRAAQAAPARAAAATVARTHIKKADAVLTAPPAVPGDDCQSAQARVADWLQGRAQP